MPGQIDILNTGKGHNEVRVDASNPISLENGKRIVEDMLRRGYALFVHGENELSPPVRVESFDASKGVYIVGALPLHAGDIPATAEPSTEAAREVIAAPGRKNRGRKAQVPIGTAHVTAIGRSAGG